MSTTATPPESPFLERSGISSLTGAGRGAMVVSLLLTLYFVYFLFSSGRVRTMDEVSAAFQVESLARHGTTAIPQAVKAQVFYGTFDRFDRPESPYPPAQAVAMLPWYAAGQFVAQRLPGIAVGARDVVSDFFLTGESAFCSALAAALTLLIFLRLGIAAKTSLAASLIVALATPLAAYSGWVFSEPLAAALLLGAAAVLFTQSLDETAAPISMSRAVIAGALLGAAIWVRPTHIISVPVFLAAIFVRDRSKGWSAALGLAAVAGIGACFLLWRNTYLFGSPFEFGYPVAAEGGKALNTFHTPLVTGLLGFLMSPGKSVFLFMPPVLLALMGLPKLWRRNRGLAVLAAAMPVVYILFYATYTQWEGGYCYGPRYLLPALVLLGLGIGPALDSSSHGVRRLAAVLFVAGFFVQAIGMATSFLEGAVAGGYYDAQYDYRMNFSPLVIHTHMLLHYATTSMAVPIGYGFDKWWVFLSKAGVSAEPIWILAGSLLLCLAASALWMRKAFSNAAISA